MPHYKKVFDIGTYTGNGGQYRVGIPTLRGVGPTGTQVAGSLRFRASNSNYLTRTPASSGNRKTWTYSCWFKKTANGGNVGLFSVYGSSSDTNAGGVVFGSSDQIYFMAWSTIWRRTTVAFKDPSRWYHLVIAFDTTQATAANRVKMYIDGRQVDSFAASSDPALNTDYGFNTNNHHEFGAWIPTATSGYSYLDMYLAETYFLDGYAYDASYFGERNSDGIWVPKAYTGSYGTNGFYLKFAPGAAGTDSSGNGNTWTLSGHNVTTANTTYDIMTDSPTDYGTDSGNGGEIKGNYYTFAPNQFLAGTVSDGGLGIQTSTSGNSGGVTQYPLPSTGKWYWEFVYTSSSGGNAQGFFGISDYTNTKYIVYYFDGNKYINGSATAYGTSWTTNVVIGHAVDMDAQTITFYRNGVSQGSIAMSGMSAAAGTLFYPYYSDGSSTGYIIGYANFGQRAFAYAAPSGYKCLCTSNISRPSDSSLWFYGDTPDLMWIKNRSTTGLHTIIDTVRGPGLNLVTSSTAAETSYPAVTEMNKFGMTVINDGTSIVNGSTNNHIYWAWKAGGQSVTNTDGTITSQVSANPSAGFSIVSWTHNGSTGTIGHGLGAAPVFIIAKTRNAVNNWFVYHQNIGATGGVYLDLTNATGTTSAMWNNTGPTSSVFTAGTTFSTSTCIAYCWTAIPGYSAFGSYTGNGSNDGPFVYTGFRPRWLLVKRTDSTSNWEIVDTTRDTYNQSYLDLSANLTNAENVDGTAWDILSNGFKIRDGSSTGTKNVSTATYIYAAFAEIPFKFARAR